MGHRERRARDEQQLRRGILGFGVWIRAVLMALTLVREYFASGLSARIFVASFLGGVIPTPQTRSMLPYAVSIRWRQLPTVVTVEPRYSTMTEQAR